GGNLSNASGIAGGFTIANKVWIENAIGGNGADSLSGNALANVLKGRGGNDTMSGGAGNDLLIGGAGRDTMTGAAGADKFDFDGVVEIGRGVGARDRIMDFTHGVDKIDLSTI